VIVIVVIIAAATGRFFAARFFAAGRFGNGLRGGLSGCPARLTQCHRRISPSRTLNDLVQLAPVQPDTPAFRTIVDLDAMAVGHHKGFIIYRATHIRSCFHFPRCGGAPTHKQVLTQWIAAASLAS
jgi:hypothetical protein